MSSKETFKNAMALKFSNIIGSRKMEQFDIPLYSTELKQHMDTLKGVLFLSKKDRLMVRDVDNNFAIDVESVYGWQLKIHLITGLWIRVIMGEKITPEDAGMEATFRIDPDLSGKYFSSTTKPHYVSRIFWIMIRDLMSKSTPEGVRGHSARIIMNILLSSLGVIPTIFSIKNIEKNQKDFHMLMSLLSLAVKGNDNMDRIHIWSPYTVSETYEGQVVDKDGEIIAASLIANKPYAKSLKELIMAFREAAVIWKEESENDNWMSDDTITETNVLRVLSKYGK